MIIKGSKGGLLRNSILLNFSIFLPYLIDIYPNPKFKYEIMEMNMSFFYEKNFDMKGFCLILYSYFNFFKFLRKRHLVYLIL